MDEFRNCHAKWTKSDRDWETFYDIPYMWNLKGNDRMNLLTKQEETHRLRNWTYGC